MIPLHYDYAPMEALLVANLPEGESWQFEPKWDGFRCLAFKDDGAVSLLSKNGKRLERYFPELVEALRELVPEQFVLDGEIVIPEVSSFSFDHLLQRIHPAPSRIAKLSKDTPAILKLFDLLVSEAGESLVGRPLKIRRHELDNFAERYFASGSRLELSPCTTSRDVLADWRRTFGERLDGVIAKRTDLAYETGTRKGMVKVKNIRTADCVIGGFRWGKQGSTVGSLLLGLYDTNRLLHHVGFCSSFTQKEKEELCGIIMPLRGPSAFSGNAPGGPSRWNGGKSAEWEPLKPHLVAEFRYDHFTEGRFRHGTNLVRWRPDKDPRQCGFEQIIN